MYNNGNDRTNGADEIMRRLMDITGRNMTDNMYDYDMNNGFRSIHGTPEGTEEDDMWSVPTISQQRPQRPPNGNNGNMPRPPRPQNPPMQDNRPQRPQPPRPEPPRPQPPRPEPPRPQPPRPEPPRPQPPRPQRPPCGKRPGYAHVVRQEFEDMYDPSTSLKRGTMWRVLDLPKNVYEMKEED